MWVNRPLHDEMPATFETAWWAFTGAVRCWLLGHRGTEFAPDYEGDRRWKSCDRCGLCWTWKEHADA